jgi:hypothetical protein
MWDSMYLAWSCRTNVSIFFYGQSKAGPFQDGRSGCFTTEQLSSFDWGVALKRATEEKANELLACFPQDAVPSAIALSLFFQFLLPSHFSLQLQQLLPFLPPFLCMFLFLILSAFLFA